MSSSDEDAVGRPGRGAAPNGIQNLVESDAANDSGVENKSPFGAGADQMEDDDADLFGSDGSDGGLGNIDRTHRTLNDEQLDSGDDEGRYDRFEDRMDEAEDEFGDTVNILDVGLARAPVPAASDGEVYTMRVPDFLSVEAEEFDPATYVPPSYSTAATSLCWRQDPDDESRLQSNARMIRWEDGSVTLQLASNPLEQYRISSKPLAPLTKSGDYDSKLDSHVYLGAAVETASVFRLTSHVSHSLTILPTALETDDAVQRLQESLAAAARGSKQAADGSAPLIEVKEDPELAQRKAEQAEKETLKAERRRQQIADREADRGRRAAMPRPLTTGLNVGSLEGGDGMLTTRPRTKKARRPNRRGEIYSDDEEEYGRRWTREDEYDEDDGFLVGSDEEIEEEVDEEDEEEILENEDMDAEGDADDEVEVPAKTAPSKPDRKEFDSEAARAGTPPTRKKHRYVVNDDEDE